MSWFKFDCGAHAHPKIATLSDAAFRVLTRIWALARLSPDPGRVYLKPGVGVSFDFIVMSSGVDWTDSGVKPDEIAKALVANGLILMDAAGVIDVHQFEEHNHVPPSKTPEAVREYMREYRQGVRNVRSLQTSYEEKSKQTDKSREEEDQIRSETEELLAQSSEKPTPAPATPFVAFVRSNWADLKNPEEYEKRAREAFPAVDPLVEAKKALGWELSSPRNRKVNHGKFFWNWLGRTQDAASRNPGSRNGQGGQLRVIEPSDVSEFASKGDQRL